KAEDGSSGAGGGGGEPAPAAGDDAERAIEEADIIQVVGNRLYALSQYSGLSVIDVSVNDKLTLLGRYQASGVPFEMYYRDGIVYAMFSSWGQYVFDEAQNQWSWVQSSRIEALNVADPANIQSMGSFDLPGSISDSRIVGDVLYAVTYENGFCWGCQESPNTTITSLQIASPTNIGVVDQLSYIDSDPYGYGWKKSVSVTPERMYIAGIEWNGQGEGHSTIQVVDISDPGGDLVAGAFVEAKGQIESRWQMDEKDGVLRVVSQPGIWWSSAMPAVQTFTVISSHNLQPLGYTELQLPKPETLRAVRFDGARAYAITAEQTDPLFTIDLTDPAQPKQMGELEIPGWIYHIEPRGDRLLTLGFDNAAAEGSLHVSLFDVSDMANPTMIKREAFGGQWSNVAEDQDRIHKAFKILDDLGLILVPYSGYSWDEFEGGCGSYTSGIQLFDFTPDTLVKRGVAESRGQARRAFIHNTRLFAVSDEEVRTFNINDRDLPVKTAGLPLAAHVNRTAVVGNHVVRLSADWWTDEPRIEIVPAANPEQLTPIGSMDLAALAQDPGSAKECYSWALSSARLFSHGSHVYMVWPSVNWDSTRIAVIDVSNPVSPVLKGQLTVPVSLSYGWGYGYGAVVSSGDSIVQAGSTLVMQRVDDPWGDQAVLRKAFLEVVDLSNPAQPTLSATFELPQAYGFTPLKIQGNTVLTSHWAPLAGNASKVKFYLDRVNVSVPSAPAASPPVNVPGSLVAWDNASSHLLTTDYTKSVKNVANSEDCWKSFGYNAMYEPSDPNNWGGPGTCSVLHRTLKLVGVSGNQASLLDSYPVEDGSYFSGVMTGDNRVFAALNNGGWYDGAGPYWSTFKLMVVGGIQEGELDVSYAEGQEIAESYPVAVDGQTLVMTSWNPPSLAVLDASDMDNLVFERKAELMSYVNDVTLHDGKALCSLGPYGIEVVDLSE
ncbi:MAG: beta-propeller domain-containing protein, partial [Polyangiaceae bacterium]|nr:beta-propeller domain-containing protein [Polyangiaceae bacterium]